MRLLNFPENLVPLNGNWETVPDIAVSNVAQCDIYRSPLEPSYVSWAILWRERSGALKLSFVEVTGDQTAWPPPSVPLPCNDDERHGGQRRYDQDGRRVQKRAGSSSTAAGDQMQCIGCITDQEEHPLTP